MKQYITTHPDNLGELTEIYVLNAKSPTEYEGRYSHTDYGAVDLFVTLDPNYDAETEGGKFRIVMVGETDFNVL